MNRPVAKIRVDRRNLPLIRLLENPTGYFKSGNGYSGETMGKFESGATIKHTKQEYHLPVA
ncbi:hypothetical protein [Haemophilus parainfluenzae]|uniref:hypothetical protein n=1 Tax=Haemophilus parainfluenzae TaxID=729 RepID=UPI002E35475D|nr:hypothetical protein [Haemophilus parainfluenzae]